jgi:ABC-type multidrug transport system fused ATPase/permease subunit
MAPPLLSLQNISLTLGGKPFLQEASLSVLPGEKICLVGAQWLRQIDPFKDCRRIR